METMIKFNNPREVLEFVKELGVYGKWKISSGFLNDRGKKIEIKNYTQKLRNLFNEKKFFRRSVSLAEVVSWMDSLNVMVRLLESLNKNLKKADYEKLGFLMEYVIKHSKLMRIDFIILYENRILLIDFRLVDDFNKVKSTWSKKKQELLVYKELLQNYIHSDYDVYTYAMIIMYEYVGNSGNQKHIKFNNDQIEHLALYISDIIVNGNRNFLLL